MLTPHMTQTETVSEVMQDMKWLQVRLTMTGPALRRDLKAQMRTGQRTVCVVRQETTPRKNRWTLMLVWHFDRGEMPSMVYYTTMQCDDGLYAYAPNASPERGLIVFVYTPHFFRRYRERMALGEGLSAGQVVRRFLRDNNDGHLQRGPDHKGHPSWNDSTHDGVTLGQYVSDRLFLGKTFVTREMAYPGRQERAFARGERNRRQWRRDGDVRTLMAVVQGKETSMRQRLRQCDEAVEAERRLDERIRQREEQAKSEAADAPTETAE